MEYFIPHRTLVCTVNPADGSIIGEVEVRDVSECAPSVLDGDIYIPHGSVSSSIAYQLNKVLPPALRIPKPLGGITALRPASYITLAENRIHSGKKNGQEALSTMEVGKLDEATALIAKEGAQLSATFSAIDNAEANNEIDSKTADKALKDVDKACKDVDKAMKSLSGGDVKTAVQSIEDADKTLEEVLSYLQ